MDQKHFPDKLGEACLPNMLAVLRHHRILVESVDLGSDIDCYHGLHNVAGNPGFLVTAVCDRRRISLVALAVRC